MDYPKIGIVGKPFNEQGNTFHTWNNYYVISGLIINLVDKNGGIVIGITPATSKEQLSKEDDCAIYKLTDEEKTKIDMQIEGLDGIILQGGIQTLAYEEYIAKKAIEKEMPIMGICAGFNNIIRALNGQTKKDETGIHDQFPDKISHPITIEKNSNLYKLMDEEKVLGVNSVHTIVAETDIPESLIVTAESPDGLVEAFEGKDGSPIFGYKFHPELMATKGAKCYNPKTNNIFKDFNKRCLEYKKTTHIGGKNGKKNLCSEKRRI